MEVKPGDVWDFIMHGPDGVDYKNVITYKEIRKPELIVYEHGPSPKFITTVTFEKIGNKTKLTMKMVFATADERDRIVKTFNAIEGQRQTLTRLEDYLAKQ